MRNGPPIRYFALCENCRQAFVATLSRFTPWVCKKCGWDHGFRGTALAYGDDVFDPVAEPPLPQGPVRLFSDGPAARGLGLGPGGRDRRWAVVEEDGDWDALIAFGIAVALLFGLWWWLVGTSA